MSQRVVESILGRLITDEEFREDFFRAPMEACRMNDWGVTPAELSALIGLDPELLRGMAGSLDPKIVRAIAMDHCTELGMPDDQAAEPPRIQVPRRH